MATAQVTDIVGDHEAVARLTRVRHPMEPEEPTSWICRDYGQQWTIHDRKWRVRMGRAVTPLAGEAPQCMLFVGMGSIAAIEHIVEDEAGVAWIRDSRVKVIEVILDRRAYGWSAEEVHFQHPHLSLAQIHAALA